MEVRLSTAGIAAQVERLAAVLRRGGDRIATAESCTGGLIAAACTSLAGSSDWFERGFVTYSNDAKSEMLGVPAALIAAHGAVSAEVACAMAEGALANSRASFAVSVTGIAGPDSDDTQKPVGLVHFAAASRTGQFAHVEKKFGNPGRSEIRKRSVLQAFVMLHDLAEKEPANS